MRSFSLHQGPLYPTTHPGSGDEKKDQMHRNEEHWEGAPCLAEVLGITKSCQRSLLLLTDEAPSWLQTWQCLSMAGWAPEDRALQPGLALLAPGQSCPEADSPITGTNAISTL